MSKRQSRLEIKSDKQTKMSIALTILGIVLILFLLVKFGANILIDFALFVGNINGKQKITNISPNQNLASFISPPTLSPLPTATDSASVVASGSAIPNAIISLYVNGSLSDKSRANSQGNFFFNYTLQAGENNLKVSQQKGADQSGFSTMFPVLFEHSTPSLTITSPTNGESFSQSQFSEQNSIIQVTGTTNAGDSVTVNGFWAIVGQNGNFSYSLTLQNGSNQIKVIATDQSGNTTEKDLSVNYSQ